MLREPGAPKGRRAVSGMTWRTTSEVRRTTGLPPPLAPGAGRACRPSRPALRSRSRRLRRPLEMRTAGACRLDLDGLLELCSRCPPTGRSEGVYVRWPGRSRAHRSAGRVSAQARFRCRRSRERETPSVATAHARAGSPTASWRSGAQSRCRGHAARAWVRGIADSAIPDEGERTAPRRHRGRQSPEAGGQAVCRRPETSTSVGPGQNARTLGAASSSTDIGA